VEAELSAVAGVTVDDLAAVLASIRSAEPPPSRSARWPRCRRRNDRVHFDP